MQVAGFRFKGVHLIQVASARNEAVVKTFYQALRIDLNSLNTPSPQIAGTLAFTIPNQLMARAYATEGYARVRLICLDALDETVSKTARFNQSVLNYTAAPNPKGQHYFNHQRLALPRITDARDLFQAQSYIAQPVEAQHSPAYSWLSRWLMWPALRLKKRPV